MNASRTCSLRTVDTRMLGTAKYFAHLEWCDEWAAMSRDERKRFMSDHRLQKAKQELAKLGLK